MPTIRIDDKDYEVRDGKNLLESCLALGFDLPYFCWHPAMGSVGACRQCAVKVFKDEQDTRGRLVMSCMEPVKEGLRLSIVDPAAKAFREQVIEWLMTNHPHDCPVCDEGGSCHLQDMTVMTGHDYRRYQYRKRTYQNQYLGPFIHHEMNRCIQCYRCVRFYRDIAGGEDLNVYAAHDHIYFGREKEGVLQSPFSGNLAEICPTGVFTDKTLKAHYTRKWDLTNAGSVCPHCSLGCNIFAGERYGEIRCITNRFNSEVNGYFLCDKGRFGYEFVNSENRIRQPLIRGRLVDAVSEDQLLEYLRHLTGNGNIIGIGSPRASVETNFSLMQLVGIDNFYQGVNEDTAFLQKRVTDILESGTLRSNSLRDIESSDAILVLGEDIWNTAPIMALTVRQSVMKTAFSQTVQQISLPSWNDIAVRELTQEARGYLANAGTSGSPLDKLATHHVQAAPDDIARMGYAIAAHLDPSLPPLSKQENELTARTGEIALALSLARKPAIISGISACNEAILKAAYNIAWALKRMGKEVGISYVLPECNSMGLALTKAPSFEKALGRLERNTGTTVIVAEQDIYRCLPEEQAEMFFSKCGKIVVLDVLHNRTTERAHVLIPSASFAEGDGSFVNNEGRIQRFYKVYAPENNNVIEGWKWLERIGGGNERIDQLHTMIEKGLSQFAGISTEAPAAGFRIHGEAVPREPHRYSGRTAMWAHLQVSEPKPHQDNNAPLSFTMEGYKGIPPAAIIPFYWAPGWNSVQALNKYQEIPGGKLTGGNPGVRVLNESAEPRGDFFTDMPEAFSARRGRWLLLPAYHLLGSGEMSMESRGIAELSPEPYLALSMQDAVAMNATTGSTMVVQIMGKAYSLPLKIAETLTDGLAVVPAGLPAMPVLPFGSWVEIVKK
ncbi:NADH-quinone oxidoreductase subunit NuoG [Flavihumibacter petaseus]|uniref:NADH-quinone oxidoreductase n=1 Tax=Flavihumibacter petaseus NBRC 106054 TaxID=1220578 RepID=A0A0E9MU78_9BACT|nr:NADH-quinone oxidoreductase subunit NuoG [Flavihumibacter petaseus]GAO41124.1 NADH--quinone oxidoreductase subunit G [Flavihumibacter petaseus NBRC 106054]